MGFFKNSQLTALTAKVIMGGQTIGALQSITIDENYNMMRVGEIGTPVDIRHVPGRYQVNITARKMLVEKDLILSSLMPMMDVTAAQLPTTDLRDGTNTATLANVVESVNNQDQSAMGRAAGTGTVFHYSFDIEITDGTFGLMKITNCSVASRRTTLDTGAVIISEDVTIFGTGVVLEDGLKNYTDAGV